MSLAALQLSNLPCSSWSGLVTLSLQAQPLSLSWEGCQHLLSLPGLLDSDNPRQRSAAKELWLQEQQNSLLPAALQPGRQHTTHQDSSKEAQGQSCTSSALHSTSPAALLGIQTEHSQGAQTSRGRLTPWVLQTGLCHAVCLAMPIAALPRQEEQGNTNILLLPPFILPWAEHRASGSFHCLQLFDPDKLIFTQNNNSAVKGEVGRAKKQSSHVRCSGFDRGGGKSSRVHQQKLKHYRKTWTYLPHPSPLYS